MGDEGPIVLSQEEKDDLLKEGSLWDIWRSSFGIGYGKFNFTVLITCCSLLTIDALTSAPSRLLGVVREFSANGLGLGLSVIALLLSGFAVFATVSQPNMLLSMAKTRHVSGLSYLKYNFFVFMRVFCLLIAFSGVCALFVVVARDDGIGIKIVQLVQGGDKLRDALVRIGYVVLFSGYVVVLLELKSFVFNTYYSVMTSLRWRSEGKK